MERVAVLLLILLSASAISAQNKKEANLAAAPPSIALLVHHAIPPDRAAQRQKLEAAKSRAFDRREAPSYWIDLQPLTGEVEALAFEPFDSFEDIEQSQAELGRFLAAHPDLAQLQAEIDALSVEKRTIVAIRRDDLGYLTDSIDLSETRFLRVLDIHLFPGHENDVTEALKILAEAYTKSRADTPWVVYQVDLGATTPEFLVLMPMAELKQNDDLLYRQADLFEAEGEEAVAELIKIAHEAYASNESNLYVVRPETSHVSRDFSAGDPEFWRHKIGPDEKSESKSPVKPNGTR